ncbi:hypothetical protein OUZ56_010405 [Daphnia magna]|uniref:Uncharacterized protein n=1 Tax=Daphnia magna TaxID=35525 RepID=A0ABR0AIW9_9CRUS|nr:hypothetical protein OUZ56_010405 [Daphnia magna]
MSARQVTCNNKQKTLYANVSHRKVFPAKGEISASSTPRIRFQINNGRMAHAQHLVGDGLSSHTQGGAASDNR